ncbi:MAG: addiction module protein [Planctomycetes bacterium]|nr:addiction module protein [Planctomycetota bacterium]
MTSKSMTLDEIRVRALQLPRDERELPGVALLSSLETPENQDEAASAWADEILARSEAYRSGQVQALDAEGTVERIRQRLAARNGS